MARPEKLGLDYFTLDVDYYEDPKIEFVAEIPKRIVDRFRDHEVSRLILNEAESYRPKKVRTINVSSSEALE